MRISAVVPTIAVLAGAPSFAAAPPAPAQRPDIVLVTLDTVRADALGFAGNRAVATPNLDRLAAAGRVFSRAHAHNVVTLPSHANILTGLYPYQHGIRDNSGFKLDAKLPTLATLLRAAGYATGAFVGGYPLDSRFGLDRGFDVYDDRTTQGAGEDQFVLAERRGDEVITPALEWWRAQRGKPRFLWVHLYDAHARYAPPEPFASRYARDPYLGEVAAVDSFLGPLLLPHLEGREPPSLVIVTADHGESLGEHGEETHGLFAYEATLRVPLVLWGAGIMPGRDDRPARHVDLFPTVLATVPAAAGADAASVPPTRRPGQSLLQPWPQTAVPDTYFEALSAALNRGWAPLRGLLRTGRKYIALPLPEVYDLAADPQEAKNLVDTDRPSARAAFQRLPDESTWPPPRSSVGSEEAARLQALGYLAGDGGASKLAASFRPEDDPKRLIGLDRTIHRFMEAYAAGDLEGAIAAARELVAARNMPLGTALLANALLEAGQTAEALAVMEKARSMGSATDTLLRQLGLTLIEGGRITEAIAVLQPLVERGDLDAQLNLALAHSEAGRQREAFTAIQGVLDTDAGNAKAHELMGLVELRLGHWAQARDASRRALERRSGLARAWNNLGVALFQLGDREGAIAAWQQAVAREPDFWDALWNLGLQAAGLGKRDVARGALEAFVAGAPAARHAEDLRRARALLAGLTVRK